VAPVSNVALGRGGFELGQAASIKKMDIAIPKSNFLTLPETTPSGVISVFMRFSSLLFQFPFSLW
jgi:hypothetical protein